MPPTLRQRVVRSATHLPAPVLRALAGGDVIVDGQQLDLQLAAGLRWANKLAPRIERYPAPEARRISADVLEAFDADRVPMSRVFDDAAPGPDGPVPVRTYVPRHGGGGLIVYFHGGGGVIGSIATYDRFCRLYADATGCAVASVEYRLAPEQPHPAAIDDARAAWRWAIDNAHRWGTRTGHAAVAGDSFGGYLATWIDHAAREGVLPRPRAQILIYPLVDLTLSSRSYELFAEGYALTLPMIRWFRANYAPDPATHRDASPIFFATEQLRGAAPALIVAAGFDCLRDEGKAYADRLAAAGATVDYRRHTSLIHGFITMSGACEAARDAVLDLARATAALVHA
jgi:acetyl esterase